jgi:hypothetical protein
MMRKQSFVVAAALLAVLCSCLPVHAQSLTGTITGRVLDQQGGALPGATVTVTGKTGSQTQVTDTRGEFRFVGLSVGTYSVLAELPGFSKREEQALDLGIGNTIDLKLELKVSGVSESVQVTASPITIDTSTTATDSKLSQSLLFSMPISRTNAAVNLLNNAPGINSGSAYGGGANVGSSLMLDGVDTRDPEGGSAWTFFNFNIIEEVQVGGLGAPPEYGGFTGAVVNTITKSGGNRFSTLSEMRFTNTSLSGNNVSSDVSKLNPSLAQSAVIKKLTDYTVQLGGPIKKDRLFFFGSVQRYSIQDDPTGPRTLHTEVSPRFNGKLTWQPTSTDNIFTTFQYDAYNQTGRVGVPPATVATQQQTVNQDSPELSWNTQYRKVFGSSTFLELKHTGYGWAYYDLNPIDPSPTHFDENGAYSGGGGSHAQYDRTRNQVNAALSKYANFKGSHSLKFGAEIEHSKIRNRYAYSGNPPIEYYDYGGQPYLAYSYAYDVQGTVQRNSFYAQDQWRMGRATLNYGVRADQIHGGDGATGTTVYKTFSVGPRVGLAVDVVGDGTSVLRAYYGRMYEGANVTPFERAVTGIGDYVTYDVGPGWRTLTEIDRVSGASKYRVDPNIKQTGLDEFNAAFEQQLRTDTKFTMTGIYRNNINFQNSVLPAARWTPTARTNPLTNQPITVYRWNNRAVGEQYLITNYAGFQYLAPDGSVIGTADPYRRYYGAMFVLQKVMSHRWSGQISYVWSRTKGTVNNNGTENQQGAQFQTPNLALVNVDGRAANDRTHELKTYGSYQVPKIEVSLNAYYRYTSGSTYNPVQRLAGSVINYSANIDLNIEPLGNRRNDGLSLVDLRAEKIFKYGIHRFGVYLDVVNLFNVGTVTTRQTRYPSRGISGFNVLFGDPTAVTPARQGTVGLRWSF